jgi:type I restriction enzyme S subunit
MSKETRIGEVADDISSFVLRDKLMRNDAGDWGGDPQESTCGVLRSTNFTNEGILNLDDVASRSLSETKRREKTLQDGDIIIERSGGSDNQPVGRIGYITADIAKRCYSFSNFIQRITLDGSVNAKFVSYCLQRMHEMGVTLGMQTQTTGIRNLDYKFYVRSRLPEPNRLEQDRIVIALESVDSTIAAVRESIAKAEWLQKGLMQQLLTGHLKPDGAPRKKYELCMHPKVGLVPRGWNVSPLKLLAQIQRGKFSHRPRNEPRFFGGPYPFVQTADIVASRGYIRQHSQTLSEEGRRISRMFPKGTIMITIAANIGDTAIVAYDMFSTDSVIGITPKDGMDSEFLELCLRRRKGYLQRMSTESAQANINYGILRPLLIVHPATIDEQKAVAAPIVDCEKIILAKEEKIVALQRLKKWMMQNLLTGRTRLLVESATKKEATP